MKAICPICGKKHNVQKDYWLYQLQNNPVFNSMSWIGYRTWFVCRNGAEKAGVTKLYDESYRYIAYTVSRWQ